MNNYLHQFTHLYRLQEKTKDFVLWTEGDEMKYDL